MKYLHLSYIFVCICVSSAFADELSGTIGLGGRYLDVKGDKAKYNEYRDIDSGATGRLNLDMSIKDYYLSLDSENIGWNYNKNAGLDNQRYIINGGKYEQFKYSLFYDETPHNITFGAKSPFNGIGTTNLTNDVSDPGLQLNSFDYGIKRITYGGSLEGSLKTPFFFGAKVDRSEIKGLLPMGFSPSSGESALELPVPINYSTNNLMLETGYRTRDIIFKIDGTLSEFENQNNSPWLNFQQPASFSAVGIPGIYSLPPDNTYYKIGSSLMLKLPANSSFVLRGSYAKLENDQNLIETGQSFHGNVATKTMSAAYTSAPIRPLTLRIFYNFFEREDKSTDLGVYSLPSFGGTEIPNRLSYHKQGTGITIGYRLPAKTKADVGYEYQQVIRNREDATQTRDHIVFVQLKNKVLDWITAKVRYQHLIRSGETASVATAANPYFIDNFRRFDIASKTQDKIKAGIDFQPLENLTLGVEYNFKQNLYDNALLGNSLNRIDNTTLGSSLLGVKRDLRHEIYLDAKYSYSNVKLTGFFDLELVDRTMKAHEIDLGTFDWTSKRSDTSYTYGFKAEVDIIKDKLSAHAGWRYEKAFGTNEFSIPDASVVIPPPATTQNIGALDNFVKQTITTNLEYHFTRLLIMDVGYTHERLNYDDDAWRGYQTVNTEGAGGGMPGVYLTGAYNNPNYEAHLGFVKFTYKF